MDASSGIGRATALRFAEQGAKVVVAARGEPGLKSLVAEIEAAGGAATAVVADVTDAAQVQAVADRAVAEYGRLDTWVHRPVSCSSPASTTPLPRSSPGC
jgi:NAD(P)-dependent dehydrogenase (short-subunit alcohol dehydrogenase family)